MDKTNCIVFNEKSSNRLTATFISEDGKDISDATVSVTVVDLDSRISVDGHVWPDIMRLVSSIPPTEIIPPVERPSAAYTIVFDAALEIVRGKFYLALITMKSTYGDRYVEKLISCRVD